MIRTEAAVLDVMRVPPAGDPTRAVVPVETGAPAETVDRRADWTPIGVLTRWF